MRRIWIGTFACALSYLLPGQSQSLEKDLRRWRMGFGMGTIGLRWMCIARARQIALIRILGYGMGILTAENDEHVGLAHLGWGRFALTIFLPPIMYTLHSVVLFDNHAV